MRSLSTALGCIPRVVILSTLFFFCSVSHAVGGFTNNYDACRVFMENLRRVPTDESKEIETGRMVDEHLKAPNEEGLDGALEFPPSPQGPRSAVSTLLSGNSSYYHANAQEKISLFNPPHLKVAQGTLSTGPFSSVDYGVPFAHPKSRKAFSAEYRAWLGEGLELLKARLENRLTGEETHEAHAWSIPAGQATSLLQGIRQDISKLPKDPIEKALATESPRLYTARDRESEMGDFILSQMAFRAVPAILALSLGAEVIFPYQSPVNPLILAGVVAALPPHKWIEMTTGYSSFKRKKSEYPRLLPSHDVEAFLNLESPHAYGLRSSDGFNLFLADGGERVLIWYPKSSHYAELAPRSTKSASVGAPKIEHTPENETTPKVETSAPEPINPQVLRERTEQRLALLPARPALISEQTRQAAQNLRKLADQLGGQVLERHALIDAQMLALIAKEHLLIVGPPGNGKTTTTKALLEAFGETDGSASFTKLQMKHDTDLNELFGPFDPKALLDRGEYTRLHDQSFLNSRHAILDELFDIRSSARRDTLEALEERSYNGVPGKLETAVGISNRFIPELLQTPSGQLDDSARAMIDRFALTYYLGWDFADAKSDMALVSRPRGAVKLEKALFSDKAKLIELARALPMPDSVGLAANLLWKNTRTDLEHHENDSVAQWRQAQFEGRVVDPPYRTTRVFSPRGLQMAGSILKAAEVLSWTKTDLAYEPKLSLNHLYNLEKSITAMDGSEAALWRRMGETSNPNERVQIQSMLHDREVFRQHLEQLKTEINTNPLMLRLEVLQADAHEALAVEDRLRVLGNVHQLLDETQAQLRHKAGLSLDRYGYSDAVHLAVQEGANDLLLKLSQSEPALW